jgi:hypothetical protein
MAYTAADVQMAEGHILQGERHIALQHELINRLREHGLPTEAAEQLLVTFQDTMHSHWEHRAAMLESIEHGKRRT